MKIHTCLICIGSNYQKDENINKANALLKEAFNDISLSKTIITKPIGLTNNETFINQIGYIKTYLDSDAISNILKRIEQTIGRTAQDKANEIIPIDIDLLSFDDIILKPDDMQRDYIQQLLKVFIHS